MKTCAITRCFLSSILVAITCIGCKSTTNAEQPKKEQDYFRLYITDAEKDTLKGPVKSIKDSTFKVALKFGEITKLSLIKSDHKKYDTDGRWLENSNGSYEYIMSDSTLTTRGYGSNGELNSYSIAYYNKHNKLSKVQYFNSSNKMLYLETFSYSSAQLLKEYSIYGSDGNLWYKYFDFKYDERNYISQYKKLSNIIRTDCKLIKIIYDANGNIISETTCIDNGDSESMIFNNNGNPTKSVEYQVDLKTGNIFSSTHKTYNPNDPSDIMSQEVYHYQYTGRWYEKKVSDFRKYTTLTYRRELIYDKYDNYTKSITYHDETPIEMTVRHIEYYN